MIPTAIAMPFALLTLALVLTLIGQSVAGWVAIVWAATYIRDLM